MIDIIARGLSGKTTNAIPISQKGIANGVATLDSSGKIPTSQLSASILGAVNYQGTWDASANSPSIATGSATSSNKGYYYVVSVAGTTTIDTINSWIVGDWVISDGSKWNKVETVQDIISINNKVGIVNLNTSDIPEGTNLYYTDNRVDSRIDNKINSNSTINSMLSHISNTSNPHNVTKSQVGLNNVDNIQQIPMVQKGAIGGVASLDASGKVPITQIPISVVNIVSVSNETERLALAKSTNLMLALQADTQIEWAINANEDTSIATNWVNCGSYAAQVVSVNNATGAITINCASLGAVPNNTTVNGKALSENITLAIGDIITLTNTGTKFLRDDGTFATPPTVSIMGASGTNHASGLVPDTGATAGTSKYLREDGNWVAPITDNSSSGYIDIGNTRIQWGHATGTSITFSVPFKDTNYSLHPTVVLNNNSTLTSVFITTKSVNGVTLQKSWYNGGAWGTSLTCNVDWQAIGLKP